MHFVKAHSLLSQENGMNIYRGCTHGCIYCDSRSRCYGMKHDFEDVEVKENAPQLLMRELRAKRRRCVIGTGPMSDPYMHAESSLRLTRRCLETAEEMGFGVAIQTKSDLILRDIDILRRINRRSRCTVQMTLTTADDALCRVLEPHVAPTSVRAEVLCRMREEGIPTVVWLCPILPYINDTRENMEGLLNYCKKASVAGIIYFGAALTLRDGDREYYYDRLDESFPGLKAKYISSYALSYELVSRNDPDITAAVTSYCQRENISCDMNKVFEMMRTLPDTGTQISMFTEGET